MNMSPSIAKSIGLGKDNRANALILSHLKEQEPFSV